MEKMMNKFHRFDIDWSKLRWAVIEEGGGRWEFDTQDEAYAFLTNAEAYNPNASLYWEVIK